MRRPIVRDINQRKRAVGKDVSSWPQPMVSSWLNFTPLSLEPELWLDASDISTITESSGSVSQWNDKSGKGRNLVQATGASQPTTGSATQNGLNVLSFSSSQFLRHSTAATWKFMSDGTQFLVIGVHAFGTVTDPNQFCYTYYTATGSGDTGFTLLYDSRSTLLGRMNFFVYRSVTGTQAINCPSTDGLYPGNVFHCFGAIGKPSDATASERGNLFTNRNFGEKTNTQINAINNANPTVAFSIGGSSGTSQRCAEVIVLSGSNANESAFVLLRDYLNQKWRAYS